MAAKGQAQAPSMSDAAVRAKTGKDWAQWFAALDKAKAHTLPHKEIVGVLGETMGVPRWWRQMVAVEYERARGLRVRHETASGFSVSISKTVAADLATLFQATSDAAVRKTWFPKGSFKLSSETPDKYFRGSWNGPARLEINFYAKGETRAQINVQVNKLPTEDDVAREREAWKAALGKLQALLA